MPDFTLSSGQRLTADLELALARNADWVSAGDAGGSAMIQTVEDLFRALKQAFSKGENPLPVLPLLLRALHDKRLLFEDYETIASAKPSRIGPRICRNRS